jgi:uncharacterized surface protein with fasciclin (FAS1) repeats
MALLLLFLAAPVKAQEAETTNQEVEQAAEEVKEAAQDVQEAAEETAAEAEATVEQAEAVMDAAAQPGDIVAVAQEAGNFSTLVAAIEAAGLTETLQGEGPFTVFAPTDEAFAKLPEGTLENLLKPENKDQLVSILTYHVIDGKATSSDAAEISSATTLQGSDLTIATEEGTVKVNDASVVAADVEASNGVIHVIDTVLLPPAGDDM